MNNKINEILNEIKKVIIGKDDKIARVLMALLAEGHILIEDVPGVGKTTLALAFSKALGLSYNRTQFTPDVVPSDIVGFSMYNKENGQFEYKEGAVSCPYVLSGLLYLPFHPMGQTLLMIVQQQPFFLNRTQRGV